MRDSGDWLVAFLQGAAQGLEKGKERFFLAGCKMERSFQSFPFRSPNFSSTVRAQVIGPKPASASSSRRGVSFGVARRKVSDIGYP